MLCTLFWMYVWGQLKGALWRSTSPFALPKAIQWVYRYCYSNCKFQMLNNWLMVRIQCESQLRMGIWKPKASDSIPSWCMCWGACICGKKMQQEWSIDTMQLNEQHIDSRIHSSKLQRSKGLKLRLEIERKKFFEPYRHIFKRCKIRNTEVQP